MSGWTIPADVLLVAQTVAYQTNDISLATEQDLTHRIALAITADRATRTTQEARDEAVRQRAVEECAQIADSWNRPDVTSEAVMVYFGVSTEDVLTAQATAAGIAREIRAALRKPANEEGGEP